MLNPPSTSTLQSYSDMLHQWKQCITYCVVSAILISVLMLSYTYIDDPAVRVVSVLADSTSTSIQSNSTLLTYHVAVVSTAGYHDQTMKFIRSLNSATRGAEPTCAVHWQIHVITDGVGEDADFTDAENVLHGSSMSINTVLFNSSFAQASHSVQYRGATQKLALATLLPDVELVMVMDSDMVVFGRLERIFSWYNQNLNDTHIMGMAEEGTTWYSGHDTAHPGSRGVNSGLLLMNLERVRTVGAQDEWLEILQMKDHELPEQDVLNIYFARHPSQLMLLPCAFNFQANGDPICDDKPILILHCNGKTNRFGCGEAKKLIDLLM